VSFTGPSQSTHPDTYIGKIPDVLLCDQLSGMGFQNASKAAGGQGGRNV